MIYEAWLRPSINLWCLYRLQSMRHSCIGGLKRLFQQSENKQKVHVMLQCQPLYVVRLELQKTLTGDRDVKMWFCVLFHQRRGKSEEEVCVSAALCHDMLDTLQKRLSCASQVMQGWGGRCCWNRAYNSDSCWKETWCKIGGNNHITRLKDRQIETWDMFYSDIKPIYVNFWHFVKDKCEFGHFHQLVWG